MFPWSLWTPATRPDTDLNDVVEEGRAAPVLQGKAPLDDPIKPVFAYLPVGIGDTVVHRRVTLPVVENAFALKRNKASKAYRGKYLILVVSGLKL